MAEVIRMPKMSDTMEEGVIAQWLKKEGDTVESGDILAEVETDKATMELESYNDGVLLYVGVKDGESVAVDGVIAVIGEEGEDPQEALKDAGSNDDQPAKKESDDSSSDDSAEEEAAEEVDASDVNAEVILMPKMSDTMEEGTIANWLKSVGDSVESGDILAEVETDKATMELESYHDGTLLYVGVEAGNSVPVDGVIAIIGEEGADYKKLLKAQKSSGKKEEKSADQASQEESSKEAAPEQSAKAPEKPEATTDTSSNGRIKASPLAKKIAADKGYDISQIPGSGEGGRVVKRDVESYTPQEAPAAAAPEKAQQEAKTISLPTVVGEEKTTEVKVSQMRKTIAKRLTEAKFTAPHFYVTVEVDMDQAMAARKRMNEVSPVKISFNDLVMKATAAALRQHPDVNSSWKGDSIVKNEHIHIGVAVAVDEGLLVPVVRFTDSKSLAHIATEVKDLAGKAKNKQLQPADWEGQTFSISNLGMFGVEEFTAIINPPNAAILAVGGIKQTPVVKNGEVVPGNTMKLTLSCDHRVLDGATGAEFLNTLKGFLEDPVRLLI